MPQDPHAPFDQTVLDLIEHSPIGAVPHTPAYVDALGRLYASHQAYASADHKGGHVPTRSLTKLPSFYAQNLENFMAGKIDTEALEPNAGIFERYVQSLPEAVRQRVTVLPVAAWDCRQTLRFGDSGTSSAGARAQGAVAGAHV